MTSYERRRWRIVNILRRLLGLAALVIGAVFSVWAIALVLRSQSTLAIGGVLTTDIEPKLTIFGGGVVVLGFGVLMLRARAYRPDLGDVSWLVEPQAAEADQRRDREWWTGDRKVD